MDVQCREFSLSRVSTVLWDVADEVIDDVHGVSLPGDQSLVVWVGVASPVLVFHFDRGRSGGTLFLVPCRCLSAMCRRVADAPCFLWRATTPDELGWGFPRVAYSG